MTKLFLLVLSFFGRKPPKPAPAAPAKLVAAPNPPPAVHPRIRTLAQQARDTVELLHRHERAHVLGVSRPSNEAAAVGWAFLEDHILPIAGYLRACIHLEMSWPLCPRGADPDDWLSSTLQLTAKQIETIVTAIRTGASLRAWRAVEDIMARDVEHQLRGCKPVTIHLGGPEARREVHLRDSYRSAEYPEGRVILARLFEFGRGGHLEIAEPGGGRLSRETVSRSGWTTHEGWIGIGGGSPRPNRRLTEKGDGPQSENTPTPVSQP